MEQMATSPGGGHPLGMKTENVHFVFYYLSCIAGLRDVVQQEECQDL